MRNEHARVAFPLGWTRRDWLKKKQPAQKETMETRALSQRVSAPYGRFAVPRARKMVFPGRQVSLVKFVTHSTVGQG